MNYQQTLEYLYAQLPMFQRQGASAYKKDLTNTLALCDFLQNPQHRFKSIHIAGTNGKGSTSHMLAAVFQKHGYKTGLYTSPHLIDFRERIRVNGEMISEEEVIRFTRLMQPVISQVQPSFFELTVAMAFDYFAREQVDIAIIETGLGGRLDSTNVITSVLSVITNIGWDHMDLLGNTLGAIAGEKAGIIKKEIPVVIGEKHEETIDVFLQKAAEMEAPIDFAEDHEINPDEWESDLKGIYQFQNKRTVLVALEKLKDSWSLKDEVIREALKQISSLTGLMGRWQTLAVHPKIIADVAHNKNGMAAVMPQLLAEPHQKLYMVLGVVRDKELYGMTELLPKNAHYLICEPSVPRKMDADLLFEFMTKAGFSCELCGSVANGIKTALNMAQAEDLIYIGGSSFVVADALTYWQEHKQPSNSRESES